MIRKAILFLMIMVMASTSFSVEWFVSKTGDNSDGLSWPTAYTDLQSFVQSINTNTLTIVNIDADDWQMTNTAFYARSNLYLKGQNPPVVVIAPLGDTSFPSLDDYYNIYSNSWHEGYLNIYQRTNNRDKTIIRAVSTNRAIVALGTNVTFDSITVYGGSNTVNNTNGYGLGINGFGISTIVTNCTVMGGYGYQGGGTYNAMIYNSLIVSNYSSVNGGGAYGGRATDCILSFNNVTGNGGSGGGMHSGNIFNSLVISNNAIGTPYGFSGGLSSLNAGNCVVYGNYANRRYGGGYFYTITNSLVVSNISAGDYGGGLSAESFIKNSKIEYNTCSNGSGGGMNEGTTNIVENCIVNNNYAKNGGGIYYGVIYDSLIYSNTAVDGGGGLYSSPFVTNCIISNNTSARGAGVFLGTYFDCDIIYNRSSSTGGGGETYNGIVFSNCYFAYNSAVNGGAMYGTGTKVYNSLIENNVSVNGSVKSGGNFSAYGCVMRGNTSTTYVITTESFGEQPLYLFNCNIMDNKIASPTAALIYSSSGSSGKVANNIFSRNTSSLIYAGFAEHNWWWEPNFLSDATYKLAENSDCIERGVNSGVDYQPDYYGFARKSGSDVDLGVAEWQIEDIAYKLSPKKKRMLIWFEKEFEKEFENEK